MSIFRTARKTLFQLWLTGVLTFAFVYVGQVLTISLEFLTNIFLGILKFGVFFIAAMIFVWKMSESEGHDLEWSRKFDKRKYLLAIFLGVAINWVITFFISFMPPRSFLQFYQVLNYYYIFPNGLLLESFHLPVEVSVRIANTVDSLIIIAVKYFAACSGSKYAAYVRENTKNESGSDELLVNSSTKTPRKLGSWRDSINHKE